MEYLTVLSIVPAAKANGRVQFTVTLNTGTTLLFDLPEAGASASGERNQRGIGLTPMKAYLHPIKKPNGKHYYAYDVVFEGERIVTDSRDPEHDMARALLRVGRKGTVTLHDANTGKPRTIVDIEKAAKLTADGNSMRVRPWKPYQEGSQARAVRGYSPEEPMVVLTLPPSDAKAA